MQKSNDSAKPSIVRVKDLPLYPDSVQEPNKRQVFVALVREKNEFERGVSETRKWVFDFIDLFSEQRDRAVQVYETGVAHTRSSLDYVRSESNILPKLAVITASGLAGVLLGIRRSNFRRFVYSTTLVSATTALCYPNEAKQYGGKLYACSKFHAKSFYNEYVMPAISKDDSPPSNKSNQFQEVTNAGKDKIVSYTPKTIEKSTNPKDFEGDKGQSRDEDANLYTTRK